jgi:hypothetical protein
MSSGGINKVSPVEGIKKSLYNEACIEKRGEKKSSPCPRGSSFYLVVIELTLELHELPFPLGDELVNLSLPGSKTKELLRLFDLPPEAGSLRESGPEGPLLHLQLRGLGGLRGGLLEES